MAKIRSQKQRFCDEYLIDLNATHAAIRAGYSAATAKQKAYSLMKDHAIKEYISQRMAEKESELIATQDEILKYLTAVMRGESESEIVVVEGIGMGESQAVKVSKAADEKERLKAAELLGKRYGLYTEKLDMTAEVGVTIVEDIKGE